MTADSRYELTAADLENVDTEDLEFLRAYYLARIKLSSGRYRHRKKQDLELVTAELVARKLRE